MSALLCPIAAIALVYLSLVVLLPIHVLLFGVGLATAFAFLVLTIAETMEFAKHAAKE